MLNNLCVCWCMCMLLCVYFLLCVVSTRLRPWQPCTGKVDDDINVVTTRCCLPLQHRIAVCGLFTALGTCSCSSGFETAVKIARQLCLPASAGVFDFWDAGCAPALLQCPVSKKHLALPLMLGRFLPSVQQGRVAFHVMCTCASGVGWLFARAPACVLWCLACDAHSLQCACHALCGSAFLLSVLACCSYHACQACLQQMQHLWQRLCRRCSSSSCCCTGGPCMQQQATLAAGQRSSCRITSNDAVLQMTDTHASERCGCSSF